jgi:hypothetical protein
MRVVLEFIHQNIFILNTFMSHLFICMSVHSSIHASIYLSTHLSIHPSIYLSIYEFIRTLQFTPKSRRTGEIDLQLETLSAGLFTQNRTEPNPNL